VEKIHKPSFSLVNIKNGIRVKVGSIQESTIDLHSEITFPGQTYSAPPLIKLSIQISHSDYLDPSFSDELNEVYEVLISGAEIA
jgi:hypothetical protein